MHQPALCKRVSSSANSSLQPTLRTTYSVGAWSAHDPGTDEATRRARGAFRRWLCGL